MKTIPFDIKLRNQIQSEENHYHGRYKVQTKSGKPVRIICWDKKGSEFLIVALVEEYAPYEESLFFGNNGKYYPDSGDSNLDLLLVDTLKPGFKLWDRIKSRVTGIVFDVVSIDYVSKKYEVISDSAYTSRSCVMFYEQDNFELVKPVSGFNYFEGIVMRCAEGPNKGSLWLKCHDKFVKSDGVTFSSEGLYYSANRKDTDRFFAELDKNGYEWKSNLRTITKKHKFKIGDRVRYKNGSGTVYKIADMLQIHYRVIQSDGSSSFIPFENDNRLELIPKEPELTEFEKELANCLYKSIVVCNIETLAKECAPKLLELAKKEIIEKLKEE